MKKSLLVLVCLTLSLLLFACEEAPAAVVTEPVVTEPVTTEAPVVTEPPLPAFDYTTLDCRAVDEWHDIGLTWQGSDTVIYMMVPTDWEIEKMNDETYLIYCDGAGIGEITTQVSDEDFEILYSIATKEKDGIEIDYDERCIMADYGDDYRRMLGFWVVDDAVRGMYLDIDYTALDDDGVDYLCDSVSYGHRDGGELFLDMDKYNSSNKILLIGNSFVGDSFSKISITLDQLLKSGGKTQYKFENITKYNMGIKDFCKDPYVTDMANGKYKVVFMCGIYGSGDVAGMKAVIDACKKSNTGLVFFIAHNEKDDWIAKAKEQYPDVMYLDWKTEIDSFIYSDATYWEFCMNDGPRHSTPLGGYVGAHMLYKAVFHEVPPEFQSTSYLSKDKINKLIGADYVKTGIYDGELSYIVYELK